jgi:hypothetical protein
VKARRLMSRISLSTQYSVLGTILLLAALLLFGGEVLLWPNPVGRPLLEWLLVLVGYVAMAASLLDFASRYRVRTLFGLLALAGLFGLCASLLINPSVALQDVPRTLVTRVLGAQVLAGLLMLALFFTLLRGRITAVALVVSALAGLAWGIWGRWFPAAVSAGMGETPLLTMLVYALVVIGVIVLMCWAVSHGRALSSDVFQLSLRGWTVVGAALAGLLIWRVAQGVIDSLSLTVIATLMVFTWAILWFQRSKRGVSLLEGALPPAPLKPGMLITVVMFLAAGVIGYGLPRGIGENDPLALLGALYTAFGVVWLPTVSLVIGGRAFIRQVRTQQL